MMRDSVERRASRPSSAIMAGRGRPALHSRASEMTTASVFVTIEFHSKFQNMTSMHRTLLAALLLSGIGIAQPVPTLQTRPAAKPVAASSASAGTTVLPTEDTVNSFLFQMFGYDPAITWKVIES